MADSTQQKVMALADAVRRYVHTGDHLSIGGFTVNRNPMAAVHEIIRQSIRQLHLYAHSNGQGLDELAGSGAVDKIEIAYSGNGRFAPTCICFKRLVTQGKILVEDYTNFQMALRFLAGAMGVPYLPTRSSLGTDIIDKWGFDPQLREQDPKLANKKLVLADNPFSRDNSNEKMVLVPAITPDITIIHAQKADTSGTTRIEGLTFCDVEQAKAARHVIVTCDQLVEAGSLNHDPGANVLPSFCVDAVVHVPFGAYPTACFGQYDYDPHFLDQYRKMAASDETFTQYLDTRIRNTRDHAQFIDNTAGDRLELIKADPATGYSDRIKRK
jgi:glutaconate CoA-transferase subunit A